MKGASSSVENSISQSNVENIIKNINKKWKSYLKKNILLFTIFTEFTIIRNIVRFHCDIWERKFLRISYTGYLESAGIPK